MAQVNFEITGIKKQKFIKKVKNDEITQSRFFNACVDSYLKGKLKVDIVVYDITAEDEIEIYNTSKFPKNIQQKIKKITELHELKNDL